MSAQGCFADLATRYVRAQYVLSSTQECAARVELLCGRVTPDEQAAVEAAYRLEGHPVGAVFVLLQKLDDVTARRALRRKPKAEQ